MHELNSCRIHLCTHERFTCNKLELVIKAELTMIGIICFEWCSAVICINHSIFLAKLLLLLDVIHDVSIGAADTNERIVDIY
ncbi:hypothetical protein IMY05_017G0046700 [Salix suchowensis]|nr:hypothetical protein IMY05_017G0046700 [Salix suchowensis]